MGSSAKKYVFGRQKSGLSLGISNAYTFEELSGAVTADKIGSVNGTVVSVTYNQTGKIGKCFLYNGVNSYVNMSFISLSYGFSIKLWFFTSSILVNKTIIGGGSAGSGSTNYKGISLIQSNDKIAVRFGDGLTGGVGSRRDFTTNSSCLSIGWNCIHVNVFSFGVSDIYVNGVLFPNSYTSGSGTVANLNTVSYRLLSEVAGITFYEGLIDELYFWNVTKSASDVLEIYNKENAGISII